MPSATPSNAAGRSGVADDQVGHIGKGILGTIEEGVGGTSARQFYYGTGVAFYQQPSTQRSYGDDVRSFNVKGFGARGMVNLPRRWFEFGPTEIFVTYPINYAWAGPEYHVRYMPQSTMQNSLLPNSSSYLGTGAGVTTDYQCAAYDAFLGEIGTEIRNGPNILPTYFWSGGVGFAVPSMIELNMGGGGNIIFDRYTNFAMIMASVPTISMRKDIMKMAGGGLYYDYDTDYNSLPVKFGWVPTLTDEGTGVNRNAANTGSEDAGENMNFIWAPVEWRIHIPIKTPQTNFWNSLLSRKPIDTSCFASDLQYILSLANFFEFSDTGTGLAHCPYYTPPLNIAVAPEIVAADVVAATPFYHPHQKNSNGVSTITGSAGAYIYTNKRADSWLVPEAVAVPLANTYVSPCYMTAAIGTLADYNRHLPPTLLPPGAFYTGGSVYQDFNWATAFAPNAASVLPVITAASTSHLAMIATAAGTLTAGNSIRKYASRNRVAANPKIWANHYRVCNGFLYGGFGKPRPKMAKDGVNAQSDNRYMKDVYSVANGAPLPISYPNQFTRMEWRNRSLKLTNPALSARLPLQSTPGACVYYPFSYGFSQTYRIPPNQNPFDVANFHRWCSNQALASNTIVSGQSPINVLIDTLAPTNKITQNIIMPANPVTSMIVGIYREKDRRYLGQNPQGSYSPVLFWNALNPVRATLYDGGNIMFDYQSSTAFEFGSLVDRPDCFRIPFRGGLCQLDPKNIIANGGFESSGFLDRSCSDGFEKIGFASSFRTGRGTKNGPASRFAPIHCTEWYNCHLLEFPFCMHEPLGREGTVQSTPSFAKTILRLEFFIDALLKPPRGLDDMYDQTTVVPAAWFSGEWEYDQVVNGLPYNSTAGTAATARKLPYQPTSFSGNGGAAGTYLNCTPNVQLSVPNAYQLDDVCNFNIYSDDRESIVLTSRGVKSFNSNYTMSSSASSWNVNDGGLLIQISFIQNQVWTISPTRTSILSARG